LSAITLTDDRQKKANKRKEHCMFSIKKKNDKVVIQKSTSPNTGRQLAKTLLENMNLKSQLEQVKSAEPMDERVKAKVSAIMGQDKVAMPVEPTPAKKVYVDELTPLQSKQSGMESSLANAVKGLGDVQTFTRDPFTGEPLYGGKDAKYATLGGAFYITNDDPAESYYLLYNGGMTFILTAGQSHGDYMSVLYRAGSGNVSEATMQSIIKAKLSLTKVKQFYKIVTPTTHYNPRVPTLGEPWSVMGNKIDWINPTFISVKQLFRCDCDGATIVF
jgi:hypothetical protein